MPDSQPSRIPPPALIVRGDDMGSSQAANEACLRCALEGVMTSVEIMPVTPWFPQAVRMLRENPAIDVGIHLTLTSEWDDIKWRPLTPCPSLVDGLGSFRPMVVPHRHYPGNSHAENRWSLDEIERELRAQCELTLRLLPQTSHVTTHMAFELLDPAVSELVDNLAAEFGIAIFPNTLGVRTVGYVGPKATASDKIASFVRMLDDLEPGRTHMFIDHPGLDTPELRGAGHIGYNEVAPDRQGVTECWTSHEVRSALEARSIRLMSYCDLGIHQGEHRSR